MEQPAMEFYKYIFEGNTADIPDKQQLESIFNDIYNVEDEKYILANKLVSEHKMDVISVTCLRRKDK